MISIIERHKRVLIALSLFLILLISGVVLIEWGLEFSGILFMLTSVGILVYMPIFWFFTRKKDPAFIPSWHRKEVGLLAVLIGLLSLFGAFEAYSKTLIFTLIFIELLAFILVFLFVNFQYSRPKRHETIPSSRYRFPSWMYWLFFIGNAIIILAFEDQFSDDEVFDIAALGYFLFLIGFLTQWFFSQIRSIINLRNEQAKTELLNLQSQVNPHFFFNMLNNLYGWVEKDPKKAKELILQISDLMRYSIYEGQKEVITLEEEVAYLENYIGLHKMRYHKKIEVTFNSDIEETSYKVMPLLFIILLENAFKHGVENLRENAYVHMNLSARDQEVNFSIENNFDPEIDIKQAGIGLKNLKRRLELVYPNKHALHLSTEAPIYKAQLIIKLT